MSPPNLKETILKPTTWAASYKTYTRLLPSEALGSFSPPISLADSPPALEKLKNLLISQTGSLYTDIDEVRSLMAAPIKPNVLELSCHGPPPDLKPQKRKRHHEDPGTNQKRQKTEESVSEHSDSFNMEP
ncbi:hypothetical protein JRQ81_002054 [Phrynocephalus forsythii]|uniref:Uncharacterized protein n=1 Tax=Phrynocephalus forsythii TaxID=171643 RepID=A0A9Q0XHL4_9SAUR|nr:hypothetical protein JRQ81_002054 [Phrynocephalus forsythii]